jgi:hypothetical protein
MEKIKFVLKNYDQDLEVRSYKDSDIPSYNTVKNFDKCLWLLFKWNKETFEDFECLDFINSDGLDLAYECYGEIRDNYNFPENSNMVLQIVKINIKEDLNSDIIQTLEKMWVDRKYCPQFLKQITVKWIAYKNSGKYYTSGTSIIANKYWHGSEDLYVALEKVNDGLKSFSDFYIIPYEYSDWAIPGCFPLQMFKPKLKEDL